MKKMNKDFLALMILLEEELYKTNEKEQKKIYKQLRKNADEVINMLSVIILRNSLNDNFLSLKRLDRQAFKRTINEYVNKLIKTQYVNEKVITDEILKNAITDKYNSNSYVLNLGIKVNYNLKKLSNDKVEQIINNKIKNEVWSDRIWSNKKILEKKLKRDIYNFLDGKTEINKIEKTIRNTFNQDAHKTRRLLRTEIARVQSEINEVWAKEHNIKQQLFMATLDHKTSKTCISYDGMIFDIDDPAKPSIPLHPHCRSVLVNVPFENWRPSTRRDNITKENVNYSTYKEWLKKQ